MNTSKIGFFWKIVDSPVFWIVYITSGVAVFTFIHVILIQYFNIELENRFVLWPKWLFLPLESYILISFMYSIPYIFIVIPQLAKRGFDSKQQLNYGFAIPVATLVFLTFLSKTAANVLGIGWIFLWMFMGGIGTRVMLMIFVFCTTLLIGSGVAKHFYKSEQSLPLQ